VHGHFTLEEDLMLRTHRRWALVAVLTTSFLAVDACTSVGQVLAEHVEHADDRSERDGRYNAEYIFAATHGVTGMPVPPTLKVPLVPLTLLMDVALLPFEVVAGCF
jgi:uncharacterized protein YceK